MGTEPEQDPATIVNSEKESYDLLTILGTEVTYLIFPKNEVACVS